MRRFPSVRRSRDDEVARQRAYRRDARHKVVHREDHRACPAVLHDLVGDHRLDAQVVAVRELIRSHDHRSGRPEARMRLGER